MHLKSYEWNRREMRYSLSLAKRKDVPMSLGLNYKNQEQIFYEIERETPYLEFRLLRESGVVHHAFSTRLGGVSRGCYESLNLSFTRGDDETAVRENFRRIGAAAHSGAVERALRPVIGNRITRRQTSTSHQRVLRRGDFE